MSSTRNYPVGARVIIRDEEWRITEVDQASLGATRLKCVGVSDLVRGRTGIFFDCYELDIRILRPEKTRLVEDHSPGFMKSRLYLEALLRASPKTDSNRIEVADRAAMDPLPYQFNPTLQALAQPRARILIADAVGIGKTLEAGILTSELIARGRGRRILVLATKAMLTLLNIDFPANVVCKNKRQRKHFLSFLHYITDIKHMMAFMMAGNCISRWRMQET